MDLPSQLVEQARKETLSIYGHFDRDEVLARAAKKARKEIKDLSRPKRGIRKTLFNYFTTNPNHDPIKVAEHFKTHPSNAYNAKREARLFMLADKRSPVEFSSLGVEPARRVKREKTYKEIYDEAPKVRRAKNPDAGTKNVLRLRKEDIHMDSTPAVSDDSNASTSGTARDKQVGGNHYKDMGVQPWDVVDGWSAEQRTGFYRGTVLSYLMRAGTKGEASEDYRKALHVLEKLVETVEQG